MQTGKPGELSPTALLSPASGGICLLLTGAAWRTPFTFPLSVHLTSVQQQRP